MRNVSDKNYRECQDAHFGFSNFCLNGAVMKIMQKITTEPDRPQMTI
jgi:hypothetical protein